MRHAGKDGSFIDLKVAPFNLGAKDIAWVKDTIAGMSLEEKIGQLFVPIGYSGDPEYLEGALLRHHIGGIMYRSGEAREMQATHRYLQENSKVPLLIGANLETGGNGIATDGTFYARQMQVAATGDPKTAYHLGKISALEGAAVGCNWAFAPVADIDMNWRNPITNVRTFGSDPDKVLDFCIRYKAGADEAGIAVAVKHFPGDGVDEVDQHILTSVNSLSCEEWEETFGKVYHGMIDAGALTIMAGHIALPAWQERISGKPSRELIPATLSPELLQGLLRGRLGFNGMVVTDSSCMVGFTCAMERARAVPYAIEAGCDMFLFNKDLDEDIGFMTEGYHGGILSDRRLHEALERILGTKAALGLHRQQKSQLVPSPEAIRIMACPEHQALAADCAQRAVTLVKDTQALLPLLTRKHKKILLQVLGDYPSSPHILEYFTALLGREGFEVEQYVQENFETARFDVGTFRTNYDLVIYLANIENASNQVTNRLSWYTFWGNGNNVPWFVKERPVLFVSLASPYHLVDVPMVKTAVNCYAGNDATLDALMEKLMGRAPFLGKSPVDPFLGKEYLRY